MPTPSRPQPGDRLTGEALQPDLYGVLVTFRRPSELAEMLAAITRQTRSLRRLVVVDNAPSEDAERLVRSDAPEAEYVASAENLGPAGALAVGMERVLEVAHDDDWIVTLDDDDPPTDDDVFARLFDFARARHACDPATGAVGLTGTRFDRRRGRVVRVPDAELHGAVEVDYIGGNQFPMYSVRAARAVGVPRRDLFFGFDDLEYGLRLRDRGYVLSASGEEWLRARGRYGRLGGGPAPAVSLGEANWRRYYSLRNLVAILRECGSPGAAVRVSVLTAFAKPLVNLPRRPHAALAHLRLASKACADGWSGRMGRSVEPT